jgi:hypothetical protein
VIIESLAAMAVVFMLLVVVVQLAFVLVAHEVSQSAVDAAARRAARPTADLVAIEQRLIEELSAVVPGAQEVDASVQAKGESIEVQASIAWAPPGPDLIPVVIQARASTPIAIPP